MKELFVFIKDTKNKKLSYDDKQYLYHIDKKIYKKTF